MKQQNNGNNPIRVLHMAPIRMGGITELVLTLSEKIDFNVIGAYLFVNCSYVINSLS